MRRGRGLALLALVAAAGATGWALAHRSTSGTSPVTTLPQGPTITTPTTANGLAAPWVTTRDTSFVDSHGSPVVLRGFNVAIVGEPVYSQAVSLGANFVRIYVPWSQIQPKGPNSWDTVELQRLDQEVAYFQQNRINVLIDFHQFHWSPYYAKAECKPGAPQCKGSGVPSWFYTDHPRFSSDRSGEARAKAAFWTTESRQSLYAYSRFAEMMATRYGHYPNVVGYEIFNEPHPGALQDGTAATNTMLRWQAQIYHVLHAVDPRRTMFVMCDGGGEGIGTASLAPFGKLNHLALDFHDYFNGVPGTGFDATGDRWLPSWPATHNQNGQPYLGTEAAQQAVLDVPLRRTAGWNIPLLVGEWGIHQDGGSNWAVYQQQMLDAFQGPGISWTRWNLGVGDGFNLLSGTQSSPAPSPAALQLAQALR